MRTLRERPTVGRGIRWSAATALAVAALLVAGAFPARAQVPALPEVPPEVEGAIQTAQDTLIPLLIQASQAAQPVANALGFALRPQCALTGAAVLVVTVAGGALPVSPGFAATPVLIFCAAAFSPGPADPIFLDIDKQYGKQIQNDTVKPFINIIADALDPVRPEYQDVCGVLALLGSAPRQVPPPFHRFDLIQRICKG
ncbi:MAG: hypothetical protein WD646_04195 [Actinomycetota bacterium]